MNGWLSPEGRFYECGINQHLEKARELFLSENPERSLERLRWLKITPNHIFGSVNNDFVNDSSEMSQAQIDFLWDVIIPCEDCYTDLREFARYLLTGSFN